MPEEPKQPDAENDNKRPQPAGPHADPKLTDNEKTPGAGTLPEPDDDQGNETTQPTG